MTCRIGVIGGGLGGLASACVLAARGHDVTLFDKNAWIGGKAAELQEGGYRFDMGPTILTLPRVLRRIFEEAGRGLDERLELVRLDPQWRCFFTDGTVLDLQEDVQRMAARVADFTGRPHDADGYRDFISLSERLHGISEKFFFWKSVEDVRDTIDVKASLKASTLSDLLALRMGRSVAGTIRRKIGDARVAQMLDHITQYVGSSPYASPAVLCSIAHMQTNDGIWYPKGGTRAVATALAELFAELGGTVRLRTGVVAIEQDGRRATGLVTDGGERIAFDAIVSNMDAVRTYRDLLGGEVGARFARGRGYEPACSGVVLYLGLDRRYEHLAHHDFVFSRDAEEEFDAIYDKGEPAPDPTCYLAAPSITDPTVAPPGGEALYVLVHAPYLRPQHDWQAMFPAYRRVILDKLARTAGLADLERRIVVERHLTPQDIHDRYNVLNGAIYGLASHGKFFGAFKPGNRSRQLPGLYLAGGAAHPGPGMPMVMMSGWIAADALDQDHRSGALAA